jgi:hypothetical protein
MSRALSRPGLYAETPGVDLAAFMLAHRDGIEDSPESSSACSSYRLRRRILQSGRT